MILYMDGLSFPYIFFGHVTQEWTCAEQFDFHNNSLGQQDKKVNLHIGTLREKKTDKALAILLYSTVLYPKVKNMYCVISEFISIPLCKITTTHNVFTMCVNKYHKHEKIRTNVLFLLLIHT